MDKILKLLEIAKKFGVKPSKVIGTQGNIVPLKKPSLVEVNVDEFKLKESIDSGAITMDKVQQEIEETVKLALSKNLNDVELNRALNNAVNIERQFFPPVADVVKFGSGEEIKGKGLEQLIKKQGTKNPPTTVAGQLETQGKKLEKAGEDLKEITEPKSVIGDIIKDYGDFDKYMQSSEKTGYVRATVRQIMREDIQAGKLKLPKELQDQVMQGIGEPIDVYRKVYGEGALEQIDSLADDLGQFRTEEEAAKFARSKYKIEPKAEPVDESKTYEELEDILKKDPEPEGKADGGRIGFNKGKRVLTEIDKLIEKLNKKTKGKKSMESVDPKTGEVTVPKRPIRRAEEPTGMTTMDPEPEIIDEKLVSKVQQKTTAPTEKQYYMYDKNDEYDKLVIKHKKAAEAHDELDNIDIYDKIAPDQLGDVMAEMEGKNVDKLTDAQRREYYKKAQSYLTDFIKVDRTRRAVEKANEGLELTATDRLYLKFAQPETKSTYKQGDIITSENFGDTPFSPDLSGLEEARKMTKGMNLEEEMNMILNQYDKSMFIKNEQGMVDVTNPENVQKMALLLRRDHPEIYKKLEEGMTQTNILDDFDVTGREPNANGGITGLL